MSRRKAKERRRKQATQAAPAAAVTPPPSRTSGSAPAAAPAKAAEAAATRPELRSWRLRVGDLIAQILDWGHWNYGPALEQCLRRQFGDAAASEAQTDLDRVGFDFICTAGSADANASILSVFLDQARTLPEEERDQARRWERERRRGVFLIQHCMRDQLSLWDPLEGAPLTLHLLDKLPAARVEAIGRGAVVTVSFQPWMARLVAVGEPEFFVDSRALALFREQTLESGAQWLEAPAPAPQRSR